MIKITPRGFLYDSSRLIVPERMEEDCKDVTNYDVTGTKLIQEIYMCLTFLPGQNQNCPGQKILSLAKEFIFAWEKEIK